MICIVEDQPISVSNLKLTVKNLSFEVEHLKDRESFHSKFSPSPIFRYVFKFESRKKITKAIQKILNVENYYSEVRNPTSAWKQKLSYKELEILKEMLNMRNIKDRFKAKKWGII